jgi:hypothetical protein
MKTKLISALTMALTLALVLAIIPALAYFNNITFEGQGFATHGGLQTEVCGVFNGAEVTGPYLLWTLTAPGARNAEISGPWDSAIMSRNGDGTFTYISGWYDLDELTGHPVKATYDGRPQAAWLVVVQGCAPAADLSIPQQTLIASQSTTK